MRLQKKSYSRVALVDLLRRRRSNLRKFLTDNGIVTYELLSSRCDSMGVLPPSHSDFIEARGSITPEVSSPAEGVVVILPPENIALTKEPASRLIETHPPQSESDVVDQQVVYRSSKKKKSSDPENTKEAQ